MANRVLLIVLLLLGLAIGICGGLEQAGLGRSIYLLHEASPSVKGEQVVAQLREAREGLDGCFHLTTASMYLGFLIVVVASLCLYLQNGSSSAIDHQADKS
jgi:hypothetical protein